MKAPKPPANPPLADAPAPLSGGSWIVDEATGTLTRNPNDSALVSPAVEAPVEPPLKEAQ